MDCQKNTTHNIIYEKHAIKNKPIKTRKELRKTYCLGCKDYTDNFKPQEIKMTNKVLRKNQTVLFVDPVNQYF